MRGQAILIAGLLAVALGGQAAAQGIDGSSHDLGGSNAGDNNEICVYCHTPHGAAADAPLWNKLLTDPTAFTDYSSTTIDGDILPVGSVSIACLTCHDGSQAMDAVINAPGSGTGDGTLGTGIDFMTNTGTSISMLGTNLSNDHPIGIQYGTISGDVDFVAPADNGAAGAAKRWWVDTAGGSGNRDKTDMILYTRDNGGTFEPFVECASCHDPHMPGVGADVEFMRISNINSNVCLACHVK